jgi:hypothetical protein
MRHCGPARAPSRFCPSDGQQEVGIRRQEAQFQSSRRYPKDLFGLPAARLWTTWGRSTRSLVIVTVATSFAVEFISSATSAPEHLPSRQRITGTITRGGICMPVRSRTPVFGSGHRYTDESGPWRY